MPLYPGSKIGVIGGGQLGRMLILECRRMGYYSAVLDSDIGGPAAQVADRTYHPDNVYDFAKDCNIATYEFEHIDIDVVAGIEDSIPVFPSTTVLGIKQSRISEKRYLSDNGFPVPKFWILEDKSQLAPLVNKTPLVAKTSKGGYDGKGLYILKSESDYQGIEEDLGGAIIAEEFVPFVKEISVICARNKKGDIVFYPAAENIHDRGVLFYTIAPADIDEIAKKRAYEIAVELANVLGIVGLLVIEMFVLDNNEVLINEFAPRPHNSGHYTMDACDISQFEMLIRAICGITLPVPQLFCQAGMVNILGKGINDINFDEIFSIPGAKLHLYGKREARERRKMGHINIIGKHGSELKKALDRVIGLLYEPVREVVYEKTDK
jgi:5-(carboxyamino)imidazole ribonucleotide synthase